MPFPQFLLHHWPSFAITEMQTYCCKVNHAKDITLQSVITLPCILLKIQNIKGTFKIKVIYFNETLFYIMCQNFCTICLFDLSLI